MANDENKDSWMGGKNYLNFIIIGAHFRLYLRLNCAPKYMLKQNVLFFSHLTCYRRYRSHDEALLLSTNELHTNTNCALFGFFWWIHDFPVKSTLKNKKHLVIIARLCQTNRTALFYHQSDTLLPLFFFSSGALYRKNECSWRSSQRIKYRTLVYSWNELRSWFSGVSVPEPRIMINVPSHIHIEDRSIISNCRDTKKVVSSVCALQRTPSAYPSSVA